MKKKPFRKIKNSILVFWFFIFVVITVIVSSIIKLCSLVSLSTFDTVHEFITEIKEGGQRERIVVFNPNSNTIGVLQLSDVRRASDIQSLQIPIDAVITTQNASLPLPSLFFSTIFHCDYPSCVHMNAIDALKLYVFVRGAKDNAVTTASLSFPVSANTLNIIPSLFTDDKLYREALSISIVNASGQTGLGNQLGKLLMNVGANVISITTGKPQQTTTVQTSYDATSYTIQRLQQILKLPIHHVRTSGISDIVITIGEKHPQL